MVLKDLKLLTALGLDGVYRAMLEKEQLEALLVQVDVIIAMGNDDTVSVEEFIAFENTTEIPDVDGIFSSFLRDVVGV
jgi:hypothetical protein